MRRAAWLFGVMARLLPNDVAEEFGADMQATFEDRAAAARRRGAVRYTAFLLREVTGLSRVILIERGLALRVNLRARFSSNGPPRPATPPGLAHMAWRGGSRRMDGAGWTSSVWSGSPAHLWRETRHALRRLLRTPGFTAAAIVTLGLAIGANTAIFSLLHRVVLSPLPYPASERLIALDHTAPGVGLAANVGVTPGLYREYAGLPSVEAIGLYQENETTLISAVGAERVLGLWVTPSLGEIIGARPLHGRWFSEADAEPGSPSVVVLTHGAWVRYFGAAPGVVGSVARLSGRQYEIIGLMPPDFAFPDARAELIVPLRFDAAEMSVGGFNFQGIARLREGVTLEQARREQDAIIADLPARFPGELALAQAMVDEVRLGSLAVPLTDQVLGTVAERLWVLLGAVGIVLLIACANLANLFLVRTDSRRREVAVRRALGAGAGEVTTYYLAEALIIAAVSGAVGIFVGFTAVEVLTGIGLDIPRLHEVRIDGVAIAFALGVSLCTGAVLGLMPLARRTPDIAAVLEDGGRASSAGGSRMRGRQSLMAAQVSLAVVLLVVAGLMVQSFDRLSHVDPGFADGSRLVFRVGLPVADYPSEESAAAFHELLLERLGGLPGVAQAALATTLPLEGEGWGDPLAVRGQPANTPIGHVVRFRRVSSNFFSSLAIPLKRGRLLGPEDVDGRSNAVVVDEALGEVYFPGEDPVGRQIRPMGVDASDEWLTIVGVVGNTATVSLQEPAPMPKMYLSLRSSMSDGVPSTHTATYALHSTGDPIALVPTVRRVLAEIDPGIALARPERLSDVVDRASASLAFTMALLVVAASLALLLGLVGVYAVISYSVAQRRREIGLRLALGASPHAVTGMILQQSGRVVALGVVLGLSAAVASARLLQALLFGVSWNDASTYAAVAGGLFLVAMLACWLPARRAARLNPTECISRG